jgi:hypothetical protein
MLRDLETPLWPNRTAPEKAPISGSLLRLQQKMIDLSNHYAPITSDHHRERSPRSKRVLVCG